MLKYQLILTYDDGTMKKEQNYLPELMCAMAIYTQDNSWQYAKLTNCETGEIIARWTNDRSYGITTAG